MDKNSIKPYAANFIEAAKLSDWSQEAHNAFVAYLLKREIALEETQVQGLMEIMAVMPSLTANASAFRQWLQSKDVALLAKPDEAKPLGSRYAGLI